MYSAIHLSPMIPSFDIAETTRFFKEVFSFTAQREEENYVVLVKDGLTIHILPAGEDIGEMEFISKWMPWIYSGGPSKTNSPASGKKRLLTAPMVCASFTWISQAQKRCCLSGSRSEIRIRPLSVTS